MHQPEILEQIRKESVDPSNLDQESTRKDRRKAKGRISSSQKRMINPFSFPTPAAPFSPEVFADPHKPLHIEIGCARGTLLHQLAVIDPSYNYLGLEIRQNLVDKANSVPSEHRNVHFQACNATVSLRTLLHDMPSHVTRRVCIQFPDPWNKAKHKRRRILQVK